MPNVTLKEAREKLFAEASQPAEEQMTEIFAKLKKLVDELAGDLLWPVVKAAHQAQGIRPEVFAYALYQPYTITGKQGDPQYTILVKNERWDAAADPYTQLDLKALCGYLIYGGGNKFDFKGNRLITGHRAFFDFVHLPYHPDARYKEFCDDWIKTVLEVRNIIEHESGAADLKVLTGFLYTLVDILQSMNLVSHNEQRDQWVHRLFREFFEAVGETDYKISTVCDCMEALGCVAEAVDLGNLMQNAGMAVADGKVGYSGDMFALITKSLVSAWDLAQKDWGTGVDKLKKAVRRALPPYAQLTYEQRKNAIALLEKYSPKLKKQLVAVIREAHQAAGVTSLDFDAAYSAVNQKRKDSSGRIVTTSLADNDYRKQQGQDPYKRLDLQGWLKYLRYGGSRQDSNGKALEDQDLVFACLGIPYAYNEDVPRELSCEIGDYLARLMDARNDITSHWTAATVKKTTTKEVMQWYEALLALLEPMSRASWGGQQECACLVETLRRDFSAALGGLSYAIADILSYLKWPAHVQPVLEARLEELGFVISDGCVAVEEDIEEFLATVPAMIYMTRDLRRLPESAEEAKKLHTQVVKNGRARDNRVVAWLEKGAGAKPPVPAALYYLGCCRLFGRGTEADRQEAFAMIRSAANKGHPLAQVRIGQHHEGWYQYLWDHNLGWDIKCDNERLRADGPEMALEWREESQAQREKLVKPETAFAWYQKAAQQEEPRGQYHLGRCHLDAVGTPRDTYSAYQCFWESARQGYWPAKYALALCLDGEAPGIDINRKKAWEIYEALVEKKYIPAMKTLARRYTTLPGGRDLIKATKLMEQAGSLGDASAYMELAHWFLDGCLVAPSEEEGLRWLKLAAKANEPEALRVLGECCLWGIGVKKDAWQAEVLLERAAREGDLLACWDLGNSKAVGKDLMAARNDYMKAKPHGPMLEKLCEAGQYKMAAGILESPMADISEGPMAAESRSAAAELLLPLAQNRYMLDDSDCFVKDPKQTEQPSLAQLHLRHLREWYIDHERESWAERMELSNNALFHRLDAARIQLTQTVIQYELAECYEHQEETAPQAVEWYTKAAEKELPKAMRALGRCYMRGIGVDKDPQQGIFWYEKAAEADDTKAMLALAEYYLNSGEDLPDAETARNKAVDWYLRAYSLEDWDAFSKLMELQVEIPDAVREAHAAHTKPFRWMLSHKKLPILEDI